VGDQREDERRAQPPFREVLDRRVDHRTTVELDRQVAQRGSVLSKQQARMGEPDAGDFAGAISFGDHTPVRTEAYALAPLTTGQDGVVISAVSVVTRRLHRRDATGQTWQQVQSPEVVPADRTLACLGCVAARRWRHPRAGQPHQDEDDQRAADVRHSLSPPTADGLAALGWFRRRLASSRGWLRHPDERRLQVVY
jgi:hypothetical protein